MAHADGFGVDLHQLRQGVLEPPGDGHRRPQIHIELGELLCRQLGRGVHRRPRLIDYGVAHPAPRLADQLHRHLFRLPAGGSVADGDMGHLVLFDEDGQLVDGLVLPPLPVGRVDHRGVKHLAGGVNHCHLTPHAVARVQPHGDEALHRGLHEQGLQIQGKLTDSPFVCLVRQVGAHLPLQRGGDEPVVGILGGGLHKLHGRPAGHHPPPQGHQGGLPVHLHRYLQDFLPFPPVHGQHLMPLGFR